MPFTPKDWRNAPDETTPITAEALEDMETRVTDYADSQAVVQVGTKGAAFHEDFADLPRPEGFTSVEWAGSVLPTNHEDGDTWVRITNTPNVISLRAAGTFAEATNPTTITPALPVGVTTGDVMIATVYTIRDSASFTFPAGWTEFTDVAGSGGTHASAWRAWQSGDTDPAITCTGLVTADTTIAQVAAFINVDTTDPIDVVGTSSFNAAAQNIGPIPGITPGVKGAAIIVVGGKRLIDWTSVDTLTGDSLTWVEIGEPDSILGSDGGLVWNVGVQTTIAPITTKTFTVIGGGNGAGRGFMYSLCPTIVTTTSIEILKADLIKDLSYPSVAVGHSQWPDTQLAEDYSFIVQGSKSRHVSGYAARFEVRAGDKPTNTGERAEVKTNSADNIARYNSEGSEVWYGWSSYFPNNNPVGEFANFAPLAGDTNIFHQFHQGPTAYGVPPVRFHIVGPVANPPHVGLKVRGGGTPPNTFEANTESKDWDLGAITYNAWWDFVFHVVWSNNKLNGLVEVWMGPASGTLTKLVDNYVMATKLDQQGYLKQGYYRGDGESVATSVVYHDMTKIGRSFDAVDPRVP